MRAFCGAGRLLVVSLILALLICADVCAGGWSGRVVHVAAGDRLSVDSGAGTVVVGLAHVRAPAREHFFWARARRALGELVFDRRVVVNPLGADAGVLRARVMVDGVDVAALMVERGLLLADAAAPNAFLVIENAARRQGRGIWGSGLSPRAGAR